MPTKEDWQAWNEERQLYQTLEAQGWEHDIETLEHHILKLQQVAPKDKADWMDSNALDAINKLKRELNQAKVWAGIMP